MYSNQFLGIPHKHYHLKKELFQKIGFKNYIPMYQIIDTPQKNSLQEPKLFYISMR